MKVVALFACLLALAAGAEIILHAEDGIEGEYIVVLQSNTTSEVRDALIAELAHSEIQHRYLIRNFVGFAAKLHASDLKGLTIHPLVRYIEQNMKVEAWKETVEASSCQVQSQATWGLARVSATLDELSAKGAALDKFVFTQEANGQNVKAYIVDTGVRITHVEFEGRAQFGFKAEGAWSDDDTNGHGTHVAGTVGGANVGVAKECTIIAVKVLGDDGTGSLGGVIAGIDWSATDCGDEKNLCVANLSLGGGFSEAMNDASDNAADILTMVVAAGNSNRDSSGYSPASAAKVITVASAAEGPEGYDLVRSSFSNFGEDVDIYGPGSAIYSAWIGGDEDYNTISGTSMASPHVAGVAVQLRSADVPNDAVEGRLQAMAEKNAVDNACPKFLGRSCTGTPNDLLQSYRGGPMNDECSF